MVKQINDTRKYRDPDEIKLTGSGMQSWQAEAKLAGTYAHCKNCGVEISTDWQSEHEITEKCGPCLTKRDTNS